MLEDCQYAARLGGEEREMNSILTAFKEGNLFRGSMSALRVLLAAISFLATTWGFVDLMEVDLSGELTLEKILQFVFVVAIASAVMLVMLTGLSTMLDRDRRFAGRFTGALAYAFFVFWSVAFGYGFFWKTFSSEDFTRAQFVEQTKQIEARIEEITGVLVSVRQDAARASQEAEILADKESTTGGSCKNNPDSTPLICGPLCISRQNVSDSSNRLASQIQTDWLTPLEQRGRGLEWRLQALDPTSNAAIEPVDPPRPGRPTLADGPELNELKGLVAQGPSGRKVAYERVLAEANAFVRQANTYRNNLAPDIAAGFRSLETEMTVQGIRLSNHFCRDDDLAVLMAKAAESIDTLPEAMPISFQSFEGAAATQYATMNLGKNAIAVVTGALGVKLPDALGSQGRSPLSENDIIALYATAAIDFALLIVSILARPPAPGRSLFERVKAAGRKRGVGVDVDVGDDMDVPDDRTLAASDRKHQARLKARQVRRKRREDLVIEDSADVKTSEQQSLVRLEQGGMLRERLINVLGSAQLADEVVRRAANDIIRLGGELFVVIRHTDDQQSNIMNRRFVNFLVVNPDLFSVELIEKSARGSAKLRERLATELSIDLREILDVFQISNAFGNALLVSEPSVGNEGSVVSPGLAGGSTSSGVDEPEMGDLKIEDVLVKADQPARAAGAPVPREPRSPNFKPSAMDPVQASGFAEPLRSGADADSSAKSQGSASKQSAPGTSPWWKVWDRPAKTGKFYSEKSIEVEAGKRSKADE